MDQWYYAIGGERYGPVSEEDVRRLVREGNLGPDDLVWKSDLGDHWVRLSAVPRFRPPEGFPGAAPAEPAGPTAPGGPGSVPPANVTMPAPEPIDPRDAELACMEPAGRAWAVMKNMLFRPFDLRKWFVLGFSAWLATFLEGGMRFNFNIGNWRGAGSGPPEIQEFFNKVQTWVLENLGLIIAMGVAAVTAGFCIWLVLLWVRSRGKFMLLHNVVHDSTEVVKPWREYARHGNSLFLWNAVFSSLVGLVGLAFAAFVVLVFVVPMFGQQPTSGLHIALLVVCMLAAVAVGVGVGYVKLFLNSFVVPIMYKHDLTCSEGWRRFGVLFRARPGALLVYGLFHWLLGMVWGIGLLLLFVVTCCIGAFLAALPYLGAVVLLPMTVYFRLFSVEYLAQFGVDCDIRDPRTICTPYT